MSYVVRKYRYKDGKQYGPYLHEVESVREGDRIIQKHVRYIGLGGSGGGVGGKSLTEQYADDDSAKTNADTDGQVAGNPLDAYNLEIVGDDESQARYIAHRLAKGITDAADVCRESPPVCAGNLNIPRSDMPQLLDESFDSLRAKGQGWKVDAAIKAGADPNMKGSLFDAYIDRLRSQGVQIGDGHERVAVGQLKATQREILAGKTFGIADSHLKGKVKVDAQPIVVSRDNYILDGHHRFSALATISPERKMRVVRVDMSMEDMLRESFKVPGVYRADMQDKVTGYGAPDRFK